MKINEIKKTLNANKEIKKIKKDFKQLTGDTIKIVLKKRKYLYETSYILGLELWHDGKKDSFIPGYRYTENNFETHKEFNETEYDFILKATKILINKQNWLLDI